MLKCEVCEKEFLNQRAVNAHQISHKNGERYKVSRKSKYPLTFSCLHCNALNPYSHSTNNKFCDNRCQQDYYYQKRIKDWLENNITWGEMQVAGWAKRYLMETFGRRCVKCNLSEWQEQPIPLEANHKDGNSSNNVLSNLELLCPNCHAQTDNYKAKNMGKGRTKRREQYAQRSLS